jgi:hypothetical protein
VYYKKAAFCCAYFVRKRLTPKDIHKENVPVYSGKCSTRKLGSKRLADDQEDETEMGKWLGHQPKDLYAKGFDAPVKRWHKRINVGGYVEK